MKYEWRKNEKDLYLPRKEPVLITVPKQKFFMINGKGDPNNKDFSDRVGVLYALAYAIRMMPKNGYTPEGYFEYTVYPLEGLWDLSDEGKLQENLNKDELVYTIMIRQPEFVTEEIVAKAFEIVRRKKPHPLIDEVTFGEFEDGLSVQALHLGSYDNEPETFALMKQFIQDNQLQLADLIHREIYISQSEDLKTQKTVLRYRVKKNEEHGGI